MSEESLPMVDNARFVIRLTHHDLLGMAESPLIETPLGIHSLHLIHLIYA
jgi:hypothetical protein